MKHNHQRIFLFDYEIKYLLLLRNICKLLINFKHLDFDVAIFDHEFRNRQNINTIFNIQSPISNKWRFAKQSGVTPIHTILFISLSFVDLCI